MKIDLPNLLSGQGADRMANQGDTENDRDTESGPDAENGREMGKDE